MTRHKMGPGEKPWPREGKDNGDQGLQTGRRQWIRPPDRLSSYRSLTPRGFRFLKTLKCRDLSLRKAFEKNLHSKDLRKRFVHEWLFVNRLTN
ncbi:hypothetical protein NPIL_45501 [Nephila pilipes]|uniref:Uncharacterized protein n=1 Tax=Nephila pilipes TaxID=299642 RepID=A0A8X6TU48_NEPPI|nr:hypothetical protein NPIL_45501 [Nephila pilipes]